LERSLGPCSKTWTYEDDDADPVGLICRWDGPTPPDGGAHSGKQIRPIARVGDRWVLGGMPAPRPLYRLVDLLKRTGERVYVAEGEKAADAAACLGLLATTSPHGSNSAAKADWRPLAGRDVAILPDHDEAGTRYAADVARLLAGLTPPATVRIVPLPELATGEDLHDWIDHHDAIESKDLRTRLERLGEATAPVTGDSCPVTRDVDPEAAKVAPILTCMADVEETQVRWLWPGRVPLGRITMLVGRPGEGKSFLTTDMAARVTRGASWPDGSACPEGSVLLISAEDDPRDTMRPRLRAHGADLSRVHLLTTVRRTEADGRESEVLFTLADMTALAAALAAHPDCRLVVVDPIGSFLGARTDAHRDNDVRTVLVPVARLAEQYDAAVLVVAHRRKSLAANADDLALGSRAFTGLARAVWHLTRDAHDKRRRLLLAGKNNLAAEGRGLAFTIASDAGTDPRIRWESDPVDMTADEAIREETASAGEEHRTALDDAVAWLQAALADGPVPASEVLDRAAADGIAQKTLKRAKARLGVCSWREGSREEATWFWRLPSHAGKTPADAQPELLAASSRS